MACRFCQIESPESICRVCAALESQAPRICKECGAPLDDPNWLGRFCHVCNAMYEAVRASRWLCAAQMDWIHENFELARRKQALLGSRPDAPEPQGS